MDPDTVKFSVPNVNDSATKNEPQIITQAEASAITGLCDSQESASNFFEPMSGSSCKDEMILGGASDKYYPTIQVGDLLIERETSERNAATSYDEPAHMKENNSIYTTYEGPCFYTVRGELVTRPLITKNLPKQFSSLPIYGRPPTKEEFPEFCKNKIKDFIGRGLNDEEFENLSKYCR